MILFLPPPIRIPLTKGVWINNLSSAALFGVVINNELTEGALSVRTQEIMLNTSLVSVRQQFWRLNMKMRSLVLAGRRNVFAGMLSTAITTTLALRSLPVVAEPSAKYVFLMIGDGMGAAQRTAAELYVQTLGGDPTRRLTMNSFPVVGITDTRSEDSLITDSAAAGTAFACGERTVNGAVGMATDLTTPLPTIAETARDAGMRVGLVSTVSMDHATPACFYAHEASRRNLYRISCAAACSGFHVLAGGAPVGVSDFYVVGREHPYALAERNGLRVIHSLDDGRGLEEERRIWLVLSESSLDGAMPYDVDRDPDSPSLADLTRFAIDRLICPEGFFLMIEGGKIDWACHANDAATAVRETVAFDDAVAVALNFYRKYPDDTLIVVTGDHECGGMSAGAAGTRYSMNPRKLLRQEGSFFQFSRHIASLLRQGADFVDILIEARLFFGFKDLAGDEVERLAAAYAQSIRGVEERSGDLETYRLYGGYEPVTQMCTRLVAERAGIGWTSYSHTGVPVVTTAIGAGQALFDGVYPNTSVYQRLMTAMGLLDTHVHVAPATGL